MDTPKALLDLCRKHAAKHPDEIENAVNAALREWQKSEERDAEWLDSLERLAVRELVYRFRHAMNVDIRKQRGDFSKPANVTCATGAANRVAQYVLDNYSIDGRSLGSILGGELAAIAKSESERAKGHTFNAKLCERLAKIVPQDKEVREVVSNTKAKAILAELQGKQPARGGGRSKVRTAAASA